MLPEAEVQPTTIDLSAHPRHGQHVDIHFDSAIINIIVVYSNIQPKTAPTERRYVRDHKSSGKSFAALTLQVQLLLLSSSQASKQAGKITAIMASFSVNLLRLLLFLAFDRVEGFLVTVPITSVRSSTSSTAGTGNAGGAFEMRQRGTTLMQPSPPAPRQPLYYNDDFHMEHLQASICDARTSPSSITSTLTDEQESRHLQLLEEKASSSSSSSSLPSSEPRIYCDLDGVLVDFCRGISEAFEVQLDSHNIDALPRHELWTKVQQRHGFFEHLSWCYGGRELWDAIAPLRPSILTGVPSYCFRAPRDQKFAWCVRELSADNLVSFQLLDKAGPLRQHVPVRRYVKPVIRSTSPSLSSSATAGAAPWSCHVITCWSERKHHECRRGDILIDDRLDLKRSWEAAGGVFIHHRTGDTAHTLEQLRRHDILPAATHDTARP